LPLPPHLQPLPGFDPRLADLAGLERPARYLGTELGARPNDRPDARGRMLTVALAFPDVYEIAHGHLGHKILYHMLNSEPGFRAERVYAPWTDLAGRLRASGRPLRSLEGAAPIGGFDVVGFSLQYELAYTTILDMLELSGIPLLAADRPDGRPLVVAGGPGASNPEPLAGFVDVFFLGDAEAHFLGDLAVIRDWRAEGAPKQELFRRLAGRPGVYLPSMFEPVHAGGRLAAIEPLAGGPARVVRAVAPRLAGAPFPTCQLVPFVKPVHDRVVVEIGRGCARGCRFCQAGFLYRPVRERPAGEILDLAARNLAFTGHDQAAFLSLSAGDHTQAGPLVEAFMDRFAGGQVALSLPSLRVRSLSDHLARQIRRVRKTGFTMAPEAGTARLRDVINKDLSEDDIFTAAEAAFSLGWRSIKLYFMAGLPTETEADLLAAADLARRLGRLAKARVNVGLAHFTPKAHTPFQWREAGSLAAITDRLSVVRSAAARDRSLTVRYNDPGVSLVEGILARGDRRLGPLIAEVRRRGARLEAWNDHFRLDLWLSAISDLGYDLGELLRAREIGEVLPWSHLFCGVEPGYLAAELQKALAGQPTPDCRLAGCLGCGACHDGAKTDLADPGALDRLAVSASARDGAGGDAAGSDPAALRPDPTEAAQRPEPIEAAPTAADGGLEQGGPKPAGPGRGAPGKAGPERDGPGRAGPGQAGSGRDRRPARQPEDGREARPQGPVHRYLARFVKRGPAALLGHLEMVEVFKRAFRRAGLSLAASRGFHPQPRLSLLTALPLGLESLDECALFDLEGARVPPEAVAERLTLPEGLGLSSVRLLPPVGAKPKAVAVRYEIESADPVFGPPPLHPMPRLIYTGGKGGPKDFNLADHVREASPDGPGRLFLTLRLAPEGTPKPLLAVRALWGLPEDWTGAIRKIATILDIDALNPKPGGRS
jgi:radical SAM family uncharacterized protein/radical SAM-linked protein